MARQHRELGQQLVEGWIRYSQEGKVRVRVAREPAGQLADRSEMGPATVASTFDASDLEARHAVEYVLSRLRCEGNDVERLKTMLVAKHMHSEPGSSLKKYLPAPKFEANARALCVTSEFLIEAALRELYSRVGRLYEGLKAEEAEDRARKARERELRGKVIDASLLVEMIRAGVGAGPKTEGLGTLSQVASWCAERGIDATLDQLKKWSSRSRAMPVLVLYEIGTALGWDYGWWKDVPRPSGSVKRSDRTDRTDKNRGESLVGAASS